MTVKCSPFRKYISFVLFLLIVAVFFTATSSFAQSQPETTQKLISEAYKNGEIEYKEYINSMLYSLFDSAKLQKKYISALAHDKTKCGTQIIETALANPELLNNDNRHILYRPAGPTDAGDDDYYGAGIDVWAYDTPEGNFKIWYTEDNTNGDAVPGSDGIEATVPQYVIDFGSYFEYSRTVEINTMGYNQPTSDAGAPDNGGDGRFDVYIVDMFSYGYCSRWCGEDICYIVVENDYAGFPANDDPDNQKGAMKVTAAHEFHHAIQATYNASCPPSGSDMGWYREATSTWMEDQVYDDVNDNLMYVDSFLDNPETPLNDSTDKGYGDWIFNEFLKTQFSQDTPRVIWENIGTQGTDIAIDAISTTLDTLEPQWERSFATFCSKNYAQKGFYKDAANWSSSSGDDIKIENVISPHTLDYSTDLSDVLAEQTSEINHLASKYYKFVPGPTLNDPALLNIKIDGPDNKEVNAIAIVKNLDGTFEEYYFSLGDPDRIGEVNISGFCTEEISEVVLVLVNYSKSDDALEVKYEASLTSPVELALNWLKDQRNGNGYWDVPGRGSVGTTAMATLAFLNAAYTEADDVVAQGIAHLLDNIHGDGGIYGNYGVYETSLSILALKATYNPDYLDEIADAADYLIDAQSKSDPANSWYGGWTYSSGGGNADLSNSQFVGIALSAAEIDQTNPVWDRFDIFLSRTQSLDSVNDLAWADGRTDGGFCYTADGGQPFGSMTAAGIWSLRTSGQDVDNNRVQAALNWLSLNEDLSFDDNPNDPGYGNRKAYYRLAFAKAMALSFLDPADQEKWYTDWYQKLKERMASEQNEAGWWSDHHGQVIDTCFSILALQTVQPPAADLWMSIILASPADLFVYDPQGRVCSQDECTIPGAFFEIDANGRQIVTLPELESGHYRMMLEGTGDGLCHLTVNGYRGGNPGDPASATEISSTPLEVMITENQVKTSDVLLSSIVGALTINVEEPKETNLLNTGWQLISLPLQPDDISINNVLKSIEGSYETVWYYENGIWSVYDPENPGLSDLQNMAAGKGYWINITSNTMSPSYSGTVPSKSLNLDAGWNLVGFNSDSPVTILEALSSIDKKYKSVWAYVNGVWKYYDSEYPGFSNLTHMGPGQGFWINAKDACTWVLPD